MDRLFPDPFVDRTEQLLKEFVASVEQGHRMR
jgi:hypothetical protein